MLQRLSSVWSIAVVLNIVVSASAFAQTPEPEVSSQSAVAVARIAAEEAFGAIEFRQVTREFGFSSPRPPSSRPIDCHDAAVLALGASPAPARRLRVAGFHRTASLMVC